MPTRSPKTASVARTASRRSTPAPETVVVQEIPEPLNFLDVVSEALFGVSLYFLLYRILTVFLIANVYNYQWELRTDFGFVPILAFYLSQEEFAVMNSNSQVLTAAFIFLGFLWATFRPYRNLPLPSWDWVTYKLANVTGWWLGVVMGALMFFFSLYLNDALRFEVENYPGFIIVLLNFIAFLIYLIAYPLIRRGKDRDGKLVEDRVSGIEILKKRRSKKTTLS